MGRAAGEARGPVLLSPCNQVTGGPENASPLTAFPPGMSRCGGRAGRRGQVGQG